MKSKINILLVIVVYLLNFAHDIQPHEHFADEHCDFFASTVLVYYHNNQSEHHHNNQSEHHHQGEIEHQGDDEQESVPFPHHHLLQSHDLIQIRTLQSTTQQLDYQETSKTIFCFRLPEPIQIDTFQSDEKNFYLTQTGLSLGLRAPPVFS